MLFFNQSKTVRSIVNDLKKLNPDELIDRLERIDNQGNLMKWHILYALRQKFASDKLFGQYIADVKATRPFWLSSSRDVSRAVAAGRFCEKHNISDLNIIGVSQSCIYALSSPINEDVADKIFAKVKNKNLSKKDVDRIIAQSKAVATIEHQELVKVDDGSESECLNHSEKTIDENMSVTLMDQVIDDHNNNRRFLLLKELAMIDVSNISDADATKEILLFIDQYKSVSLLKKIALFRSFIKVLKGVLRGLPKSQ